MIQNANKMVLLDNLDIYSQSTTKADDIQFVRSPSPMSKTRKKMFNLSISCLQHSPPGGDTREIFNSVHYTIENIQTINDSVVYDKKWST